MRPALVLVLLASGLASAQGGPAVVRMLDDGSGEGPAYVFDPAALRVAAGGSIAVHNAGMDVHTFTHDAPAESRLFHTGPVEPGRSADLPAPAAPGEYPYHCVFHGGMRGTLTVTAAPADSTTTPPTGATGRDAGGESGEDADAPLPAWVALAALAGAALVLRRRA